MNKMDMLKDLRTATQAGMKDCKEALEEALWDFDKAVDLVKVKGLNVVSGREGRVASEGAVMIAEAGNAFGMIEVNCQTDFVANSPDFKNFVGFAAAKLALTTVDSQAFSSNDVEDERKQVVSTTKENVVVRRWWVEQAVASSAKVFSYVHSNGKIGVLLTLLAPSEQAAKDPSFTELGNDLVMQVAAMSPLAVSPDRLDEEAVKRQKGIFETQLVELNKPQASWAKILDGKLNKWHTEVCLLNQESVVVPKTTVQTVLKNVGTKLGGEVQVVGFIRCQVGEGIEKASEQLADEVAKLTS